MTQSPARVDETQIRVDTHSPGVGVRVVHMSTGIYAECSQFPMQSWNKHFALGALSEKLTRTDDTERMSRAYDYGWQDNEDGIPHTEKRKAEALTKARAGGE